MKSLILVIILLVVAYHRGHGIFAKGPTTGGLTGATGSNTVCH